MGDAPYKIMIDQRLGLLTFSVQGFWSDALVAEFREALITSLSPIIKRRAHFDLVADLSGFLPQSKAISDQMQESLLRGTDLGMRRVACVVTSMVTRLQFARVAAAQNFKFFSAVEDAVEWAICRKEESNDPLALSTSMIAA